MLGSRKRFTLQMAALLAASIIVVGCSDDDSTTASNSTSGSTSSSTGSTAPPAPETITLQGTPPTTVEAEANYYFEPKRSASSSMVTFKATGLPTWAHLDSSTGALSGIPGLHDEGTSGHIVITASNDTSSTSMAPFVIKVTAPAASNGSVLLSWQAPTENVDGTPISNLAGYHIYYGKDAEDLTSTITVNSASTTSYVVKGLEDGAYYFSVVAFNTDGLVSGKSNLADQMVGT